VDAPFLRYPPLFTPLKAKPGSGLHKTAERSVRVSGRLRIAQRFYRWDSSEYEAKSVKRTIEKEQLYNRDRFSRPLPGLDILSLVIPAVNYWAIIIRPLARTNRKTVCANLPGSLCDTE